MSISEGKSPPSSSSGDTHNPSINSSSPSKAKCSLRSLVAQYFKSKQSISKSKPKSKPNPPEDPHHDAPSSSVTTANKNDDHRLRKLIRKDLFFMKESIAEAKKYVDSTDVQIKQAHEKFEELQERESSWNEFDEFKKAITKLKSQVPSQLKFHSAHSNPRHNPWPDINKPSDEMMYVEPKSEDTIDSANLLKTFLDLDWELKQCLLYFFLFPPKAVIKRRVMFYLLISSKPYWDYHRASLILDELVGRRFIEPICQKCSLVPDSCRMSLSVWYALLKEGTSYIDTSKYNTGQIAEFHSSHAHFLINACESIIDDKLLVFDKRIPYCALYLGRWQSSATHHIEVANSKALYGPKNLEKLSFISLQGISMITELPSFISKVPRLKILDLRACHNLEVLPDWIGSLSWLTHLDMSECYFLEYMPKSIGKLSFLRVLKGFFIGYSKHNTTSCTLADLSKLVMLRKLNIYTSVKDFPTERHLSALQTFEALEKLTISWGGCSSLGETNTNFVDKVFTSSSLNPHQALPSTLRKLDLQCFPETSAPSWLCPKDLNKLKKLYIRGGHLHDIPPSKGGLWTVKILRLKYLGDLEMDWKDLRILFSKLIFVNKVECPKLTNIPCDDNGVWINKMAIHQAQPMDI